MKIVNLFDRTHMKKFASMYPQANMAIVEGLTKQDLINLGYKEVCSTTGFGYRAAWKNDVFICRKGKHKGMLYTLAPHSYQGEFGRRVYWALPENK